MRLRRLHLLIKLLYLAIDIFFILLAFYLAFYVRHDILSFKFSVYNFIVAEANPYRPSVLIWLLIVLFMNQAYGLYQTKREELESVEVAGVLKSISISMIAMIVIGYVLKFEGLPRGVAILSVFFMWIGLSSWRILKKILVDYLVRQGYNNFKVLIIGAGKVGKNVAYEIAKRPGLGLKMIGFLDDHKTQDSHVLGKIDEFEMIAQREFVEKVYITLHHDSLVFMKILEVAKDLGIAVHVVPQGYEILGQNFSKYNLGIIPVLEYSQRQRRYNQTGKRLFDCLTATMGLLAILPALTVIAVLIKLDSPGPVFFKSRRYGRGGHVFNMYKFRSMVFNAPDLLHKLKDKNEVDGPIFKMRRDPRVTKVGALLRKYSLDELPQILNVIKGDMSLVGPRPLPIEQVEKEDLRQLKRLDVRPGITGLWQIKGRSDVSFDRLVRWDIWYISNWSFALDLYILFQTIPVVIKGKGAY